MAGIVVESIWYMEKDNEPNDILEVAKFIK